LLSRKKKGYKLIEWGQSRTSTKSRARGAQKEG